jgi:hypothetical protein
MERVRCIANGLTVAGIPAARTFVPGDVVDLDVVIHGQSTTWRDAIGRYRATHFDAVSEPASVPPRVARVTAPAGGAGEGD